MGNFELTEDALPLEFQCWGKLRRHPDTQDAVAIHPLLDHMVDVACCFAELARCPAIERALTFTAQRPLTSLDFQRLTVLALLHDLGKASAGFQVKFWCSAAPAGWPLPGGHGSEALELLEARPNQGAAYRARQCLPLADLSAWGDATGALLVASICHHGRPLQALASAPANLWLPIGNGLTFYEPAQALARMGPLSRRLCPRAFDTGGEPLPEAPAFSHLFAGLVQLADWLGSDTRDGFFPYSRPEEDRCVTAPARACHAVQSIGLQPQAWREVLQARGLDFSTAFALPRPREMQAATANLSLGHLLILEAETGSGKTEAALWRFLHLFATGAVDGLYFALPTRVAATQLYERVRDCVARLWPGKAPVVLRALPGYEAADGHTAQRLPHFEVLWSDRPQDSDAERRWAAESPKRFLAATLAIGTIDQALLAALPLKHAHLRHAMLARSLLVVDEVHASDAYMTALLEKTLQAHLDCGGQALLLSATLGSKARQRFVRLGTSRKASTLNLKDAAQLPYPALSHNGSGPALRAVAGNPHTKTVHWALLDAIDLPECIAAKAIEAAEQGARVLVIRNTVPAAVATLRAIEAAVQGGPGEAWLFRVGNGIGTSGLHHSRFSKQDRPMLDRAVEAQLGKHRSNSGGRIIVGTQTLEQSLDLDADLLITDLCPMDVLLQRVGRLHRHQRPSAARPHDLRPAGFEQARAWVLTPARGDLTPLLKRSRHGLGPIWVNGCPEGIYPDVRMLEATRRLVMAEPTRTIPNENRLLVEHATHPEALCTLTEELGADWAELGNKVDGAALGRSTQARLQAIAFDRPFGEDMFPDDERIATRLGAADRLVLLPSKPFGPFGQQVEALTLRHHQLPPALDPDAQAERITLLPEIAGTGGTHATGFEFDLGNRRYRYDRFGLARLPAQTATTAASTVPGTSSI